MASRQKVDPDFPCSLIIKTPFPTHRLASTALQALQVDEELSPLVRRKFSLVTPPTSPISISSTASSPDAHRSNNGASNGPGATPSTADTVTRNGHSHQSEDHLGQTVLLTEYSAKTNRMLRVAVNGFMESLGVVLGVMERLDVDVMAKERASAKNSEVPVPGTIAA